MRAHLEVFALKVVDLALCALELVLERGLLLLQLGDVHDGPESPAAPGLPAARAATKATAAVFLLKLPLAWGEKHVLIFL